MRITKRWIHAAVTAAALLAAAPAGLLADTVWTRAPGGTAKPFERKGVKVQDVKDGELVFKVVASDRQDSKPLAEIWQVQVDDEPALSAAEASYAAEDFGKAATEYGRAMDASKKTWVKFRAATRGIDAAAKSNNFAAVVRGYATLVRTDPAAAVAHKPAIPKSAPGSLDAAVKEADRAANASGLSADQKNALLTLQLELARANGDNATASKLAELITGGGDGPASAAAPRRGRTAAAGGATTAAANQRIQLALVAIGNNEFDKALKQINDAPEVFAHPEQQVDALFCLGEAKAGLAKADVEALKEAGLDYMRAVARAKSASLNSPRVPEALLKTAMIHEKIKAVDEAAILYRQIATEYKETDAGRNAATALARLAKEKQSS